MQLTIYCKEDDQNLLRMLDAKATQERKSRSAMILTIFDEYFGTNRQLGDILCGMGKLKPADLEKALKEQQKGDKRPLGELLIAKGLVTQKDVMRALAIQKKK